MFPSRSRAIAGALGALLLPALALAQAPAQRTLDEVVALMASAKAKGQLGTARRTKSVDAREAHPGEVVVTAIKGEGTASQSRPARHGDWVVRNRCPETGNEQYLVAGISFGERFRQTGAPISAHGWREYRPVGSLVQFLVVPADTPPFRYVTAAGDTVLVKPGDTLVQSAKDESELVRIATAAFACGYNVVTPPGSGQRTTP
jgi:hypothetical protein